MTAPAPDLSALLARLREVEQAATKGPWRVGVEGSEGSRVNPATGDKRSDTRALLICNGRVQPEDGRNAAFIATARDAMPRLLAFAEAVLALHQMDWSCGNPRHTNPEVPCPDCGVFCRSCGENWPCPTAALAEHLGGEGR